MPGDTMSGAAFTATRQGAASDVGALAAAGFVPLAAEADGKIPILDPGGARLPVRGWALAAAEIAAGWQGEAGGKRFVCTAASGPESVSRRVELLVQPA